MTSPDWGLRARMAASLALLCGLAVAFFLAVWAVLWVLTLLFVEPAQAPVVSAGLTAGLLLGIGTLEYDRLVSVEGRADATIVTAEEYPDLDALVTNVAARLDVPKPTIAISERRSPEAMVVGLRPANTTLVLSHGTFGVLDAEELEAVIAHELAHVANRDAAVMTLVSVPAVIADGLRTRLFSLLGAFGERIPVRIRLSRRGLASAALAILLIVVTKLVLITIATVTWVGSRTVVAVLSRARETAADRTAADLTGSPVVVASALQSLEDGLDAAPQDDLRAAASTSSLSILPIEERRVRSVTLGPEGEREPFLWSLREPIHRYKRHLFRTHPPTERRIDDLLAMHRDEAEAGSSAPS